MTVRYSGCTLGVATFAALHLGLGDMAHAASAVRLAPHRAVYDMTLGVTRNSASVTGVRGRMVYEITGNACEGWTQNMRLVTEMSTTEGQPSVSDLRSSTWEDGVANLFRFNTSQLRDQKPGDTTMGDAKRATGGPVAVELTKPAKATVSLPANTYYPVQHSIALIEAARAGKTTMRADLYDGSEKGDKAYDTLARIGRKTDTAAIKALPQMKGAAGAMDAMTAWPMSISYFEPGKDKQDATPVYELSFLFFENGVSRKMVIDYGDFSIKGEITEIEMLDVGTCDAK
jgi:EipB-like